MSVRVVSRTSAGGPEDRAQSNVRADLVAMRFVPGLGDGGGARVAGIQALGCSSLSIELDRENCFSLAGHAAGAV